MTDNQISIFDKTNLINRASQMANKDLQMENARLEGEIKRLKEVIEQKDALIFKLGRPLIGKVIIPA